MGIIRQLFDKSTSVGFSLKSEKAKTKYKSVDWASVSVDRTPRLNIEEQYQHVDELLKKFPGSPDFLGDTVNYPEKPKRSFLFFFKRQPNLAELRDEVNRFSESKEVLNPRPKLKKFLKKHPYLPDLRAINGIQIFTDARQSGLDDKKLDVLQKALVEMGAALHNGCLSIFNVSWFVRIYLRYLELLKERYANEYNMLIREEGREFQKLADKLSRTSLKLTSMLSIRDKLGGLTMLNAKLKGSVYITSIITQEEIKSAATAALQNDLSKPVTEGKTANYILLVVLTLGLLLARIPMFKNLVAEILKTIPDITRDLILQKNMIRTMTSVTDFQIAISSGDVDRSKEVADKLYKRCKAIITQHLEHSILTKPHEVDPFLKAAWIAKESSGLISEAEYRERLEESMNFLNIITGNQGKVKGAFELARQLQNDISFIMAEYGWSPY